MGSVAPPAPALMRRLPSSGAPADPPHGERDPFRRLPSHAEPVAGLGDQTARQARRRAARRVDTAPASLVCLFRGLRGGCAAGAAGGAVATAALDPPAATVGVVGAPPKGAMRVREKLREYAEGEAAWPLTASILDPVRCGSMAGGRVRASQGARGEAT
jgi:hypothetical protein